jgi:hydrogenase expression/formation protein HypD
MQIIEGIAEICRQIALKTAEVKSIYHAVVKPEGNVVALNLMDEIFETADGYWRGIGLIPQSAHRIRPEFKKFDAHERFGLSDRPSADKSGCQCGKVLTGNIDPPQCPMFESTCTPDSPVGPCMVSSEGACAAWYKYGRRRKRNLQ